MVDKHIIVVADVLNEQRNQFLSWEDFCKKYDVQLPFLIYYRIVAAIPRSWKVMIKGDDHRIARNKLYMEIDAEMKFSKYAYWLFIKAYGFDNYATQLRWEMELAHPSEQ